MLAAERKHIILEQVHKNRIVKVVDLSKTLNTTEATIRRDLEELQTQKKVHRVYGGAIAVSSTARQDSKNELKVRCIEEKKLIAKTAYEFIDNEDALILDASTTVLELAKLISKGEKRGVSIITNSFDVIAIFGEAHRQDINIFHTGGHFNATMNTSFGNIAIETLENVRVDKCFLGVNGIKADFGYSCPSLEDAAVKKCMIKSSRQHFVLADHTKISQMYMGKFANFTGDIDYLIVDTVLNQYDKEEFSKSTNLILTANE